MVRIVVPNATCNNILAMSWWQETGVPAKNHQPAPLREIQAAMFRLVILTCFLAGGKFDNYSHNATVMSIYIIY
jgi:hypothetical protein